MTIEKGPYLLLDASSPCIHAGVLESGRWRSLARAEGDALELIPTLVARTLDEAGIEMGELSGFVHCVGPGGLLGLRLAAMSIDTWRSMPGLCDRPLLTYRSLNVASAIHGGGVVVAPFRKGLWNVCRTPESQLELLDDSGLAELGDKLLCIPQRHLRGLPECVQKLDYDLQGLPAAIAQYPTLLRPAEHAEVFVAEENDYKLWSGERHRAANQ